MAATLYNIVYLGDLMDGFSEREVLPRICTLFSLDETLAKRLIRASSAVLKRNLGLDEANLYARKLEEAGLRVKIELAGETFDKAREEAEKAAKAAALVQEKKEEGPPKPLKRQDLFGSFIGTGGEYFRIWIVNLILTVLSLGIYSAWAKVRRKQFYYMNTRIGSDGFRYTAKPTKILVGRVIVVTLFVGYSLVAEFSPEIGALISFLFLLIFPWFMVKSFRFNAQNTVYRNVRFGFDGTVWGAAKAYMLWPMLAVLTLGILTPFVLFRQHAYYVENIRFGTTKFEFRATGKQYYQMFLSLTLPAIIFILAVFGAWSFLEPLAVAPLVIFYFYVLAWFSVKTANLVYSATRIAGGRLQCQMEIWGYFLIVVQNTILTAITVGLYHPWAKVRAHEYKVSHISLHALNDLDQFVAAEEKRTGALGEEVGDFFDFDMGI